MLSEASIKSLSSIFNALGNELRLRILLMVANTERPLHIKAISKAVNVEYSKVYGHIKSLQGAGLIHIYDVGRSRVVMVARPSHLKEFLSKAEATADREPSRKSSSGL